MRDVPLLFLCLAAACGGRFELADSNTDGGTTDDGGTDAGVDTGTDTGTPTGIEGSWDLRFTGVDVSSSGQNGPSPSVDHAFRVDLKKDPSGAYIAVVTPRWGQPAPFEADVQPKAVRLSGQGALHAGLTTDTWSTYTLPRDASGALDGSFTAGGTEETINGDVGMVGSLGGRGTAVRDRTAPELQIDPTSPAGPDKKLLPWDPIVVRAAEPVSIASPPAIYVTGASGLLPLAWEPDRHVDWAGTVQLTARRTTWTGKGADAKLAAPEQVGRDLAGLGTPTLAQPLPFLDVPPPLKIHDFDGDSLTVALWGLAKVLSADPICESGGCVKLEFPAGYCNVPRVGLALRLDTTGATAMKVRYRVLTGPASGGNGPPMSVPTVFTLEVAPLGAAAQRAAQNLDQGAVKTLPAPIAGYAYGTDWANAGAALPTSAEAGVAIYGSNGPSGPNCGLVPESIPVALVIDMINAQ
jgi:hypothetical protein